MLPAFSLPGRQGDAGGTNGATSAGFTGGVRFIRLQTVIAAPIGDCSGPLAHTNAILHLTC
jgi:hypothetical protein